MNLFSKIEQESYRPLADRLRPQVLADVLGQEHVTGEEGVLKDLLESGNLPSIILWGPPGSGKTTIAKIIAEKSGFYFSQLSAVASGIADMRKVFEEAKVRRSSGKRTILFIDEIHRFNRAQQDVLLPYIEDGTVTLIGATTENPSFELNSALLSRGRVVILNRLSEEALLGIISKAEHEFGRKLPLDEDAKIALVQVSDGDGRYLINLIEEISSRKFKGILGRAEFLKVIQQRAPVYDKSQESHYNLISALHKSVRGSDPDASLYWLARMLTGGEHALYILRRMVRMATEDIGLADPGALRIVLAAKEAYDFLGSPEGELAMAEAIIYLALAPKSNSAYTAFGAAMKDANKHGSLMPPAHILNAPTSLMKDVGYGKGYKYDHDEEDSFSGQNYFPDEMPRGEYYHPTANGTEAKLKERVDRFQELRRKKAK